MRRSNKKLNVKKILMIVFCVCMFAGGAVSLFIGISGYVERTRMQTMISGLKALERHDFLRALTFFRQGEKAGDILGTDYMAWLECRRGNFERALEYARRSVSSSKKSGSYEIMGDLALLNYGSAVGAGAAIYYFNEANNRYHYSDGRMMKFMLERALDLCQDRTDFQHIVDEGIRWGSTISLLYKGDLELLGEKSFNNPVRAVAVWEQAATQGVVSARTRMGAVFWHGLGMNRDFVRARELFTEAASKGDSVAMYNLGLIALRSPGSNMEAQALKHFKEASDLGYGPASTALAVLFLADSPDDPDSIAEGRNLLAKACVQGDPAGVILYCLMIYDGFGRAPARALALSTMYELREKKYYGLESFFRYISMRTDIEQHDDEESIRDLFYQITKLCALQLRGEVYFDDGLPEARTFEHKNENEQLPTYVPQNEDKHLTEEIIRGLGKNYAAELTDPATLTIDGQPLLFPEMCYLLTKYNPTSGAEPFRPLTINYLIAEPPQLPESYNDYFIDMGKIQSESLRIEAGDDTGR